MKHKKPIHITIAASDWPAQKMRYKTVGDWIYHIDGDELILDITVANTKNTDYDFLIILHEIVECYLCYKRGISDEEVTQFDKDHEKNENPGNLTTAPYHNEHRVATIIEKLLARELHAKLKDYDKKLSVIYKKIPSRKVTQ